MGIDFLSISELLHAITKNRLRLIRARPNFPKISDIPNVSLVFVDCSLYARRDDLKDDYHKKRMDMLAHAPVENNFWRFSQRHSSYLRDKNNSFKKTFPTMLPLVQLRLK